MPSGGFGSLLLLVLPLFLLGFLMLSQRRRTREQQAIQASLVVGDEVMTSSGLYGRLVAMEDTVATLEIAPGVQVRFDRRAVTKPQALAAAPLETTDSAPTGSTPGATVTDETPGGASAEKAN